MQRIVLNLITRLAGDLVRADNDAPSATPLSKHRQFRGALALHRDRSQHRRYTTRYEDLQN